MKERTRSEGKDKIRRELINAPAWTVAGIALLGMILMLGIVIGGVAMRGGDTETVSGAAGGGSSAEVSLEDFKISPTQVSVEAGDVSLVVTNKGPSDHDLEIEGVAKIRTLAPGASDTLAAGRLEPGSYKLRCTIAGHAEAGMIGTLEVKEGSPAAEAAGAGEREEDWKAIDDAHEKVVKKFLSGPPAETKGLGAQDMEFKLVDGVKVFDITAKVVQWEVAPGKTVEAWTYNGTVPGPTIRVNVGDRVRVNLKNELPQSTSIHFHGLETPNDQDGVTFVTQDPVKPGDSFTYEFTTVNEGSHMYHSHHAADTQVPLGLVGAFIIGPPPVPVDSEYVQILTDGPLGFGINGKGFPATAPIVAKPGERTLIRFMNEGLIIHPMHLHGHRMTVVAKDGNRLPVPYEVDTLNVAPGERYDVVVTSKIPGAWAFHCHILTHAESPQGLHGMTTVWVVKP
jgi:uncharacterized cupredoxin-like copper-binding protein